MRRGETPIISTRLPGEYRHKLDSIARWLHETRGLPISRRVALEYLLDKEYHGGDYAKDQQPGVSTP